MTSGNSPSDNSAFAGISKPIAQNISVTSVSDPNQLSTAAILTDALGQRPDDTDINNLGDTNLTADEIAAYYKEGSGDLESILSEPVESNIPGVNTTTSSSSIITPQARAQDSEAAAEIKIDHN